MTAPVDGALASGWHGESGHGSQAILERLAAAESEIDAIYENVSFGSYCIGPDGTYATINALELSWLGCSSEELTGKRKPREFLTAASQSKLDHYMDKHGRYGFSDLVLDLMDVNEKERPISLSFSGIFSEDGLPIKNRFVSFDMTAIRLSRDLQRIAAISFESLSGMCVTDSSGTILRVNAGFTTLTGYSSQEAVGQNMSFQSSGIQATSFYEALWQSLSLAGYWQGEVRNRRKNGDIITEWVSITAVRNEKGVVTNYVGTSYDITAAKASQDEVTRMAFHDTLTQLPNRRLLQQRIEQALAMAGRNRLHSALLFVDLDHFKSINDTLGHEAGDLLLIEAGRRMQAVLRTGDTVARVGGDEFAVLLQGMGVATSDAATQTRQIGEKLLETLAAPYHIKKSEFRCTASIGVSMINAGESASDLLTQADLAMYQVKKHGRNALQFFDPVMQSTVTIRAELEQDLRRAVDNSEFEVHFQPQVGAKGALTGVEALLRWRHPKRGLVFPGLFIPLAEECGLIVPIGKWVLETACNQMKLWQQHASTAKLTMAVNVSATQFYRADFVDTVLKALKDSCVNPALLELEVTESMMIDIENVIGKMTALGAVGVKFSMDDFGTGYSSLANLTRLPLSKLKIDQSFVSNMSIKQADRVIVQTIVAMAGNLGLAVIAEGVETSQQREQLASLGCENYQGYLFGKAQSAQEFARKLLGEEAA